MSHLNYVKNLGSGLDPLQPFGKMSHISVFFEGIPNTTDKTSISNSVFLRTSEGSIDIQSGKEVVVVTNKFNINAIKVVKSKAG